MTASGPLRIAIPKGRLFQQVLPLLEKLDIRPANGPGNERRLIIATNRADIQLIEIRATDVPTFVEYGAADLGVTGRDVLFEHAGSGLYEPLDLQIGKCRLMVAGPVSAGPPVAGWVRPRIATKYSKTTLEYFAGKGIQVDIVKLYGSMELAPLVGLADYIVDLVETGNTLAANGLKPMEKIADISAQLIVNKAAMKLKHRQVQELILGLEQVLEAG